MAFDWNDYLSLARWLQGQAGGPIAAEAILRTVVSRAYYAAFGHALQYAVAYLEFAPRIRPDERAQDHGRLRAHLTRRRRRQVAETLDDLRQWRNDCDYVADLSGTSLSVLASNAIAAADYVFKALALPSQPLS